MSSALLDVDYLVIGGGMAGAATAWRLSERGHDVALVERAGLAAHDGSSHGSARIFRYAYHGRLYTEMVKTAREQWTQLESEADTALITPTGAVDFGQNRSPGQLAHVLRSVGIEHEVLTAAAATERWPQFAFDTNVLWHPGAGVIDAETSVQAMADLASKNGAELRVGWEISEVERNGTGYVVRTKNGDELRAANVVVCAGGWLPDLLSKLPIPNEFVERVPRLEVRQEQAFHFPYRESPAEDGSVWPTFIHKEHTIQTFGLPGGRDAEHLGQKVAEFNGGLSIGSAARQDGEVDAGNRARIINYVTKYLPGLEPEPYAETTCLFTNTPTEDFIIDRVENITIVSACSGHGAKFAPLIGSMAADLATGTGSVPAQFRVAR